MAASRRGIRASFAAACHYMQAKTAITSRAASSCLCGRRACRGRHRLDISPPAEYAGGMTETNPTSRQCQDRWSCSVFAWSVSRGQLLRELAQ